MRRQEQGSGQGLSDHYHGYDYDHDQIIDSNNHQYMDKILDDVVTHALKGLKNISDDISGASAQVLCCFVKDYYVVATKVNENENNEGSSLSSRRRNHRKKVNQIISPMCRTNLDSNEAGS